MVTIPVFFSDAMVADSQSFSPSAMKPKQVVAEWLRLGLDIRLYEPTPVSVDEIARAHDREHVLAILTGKQKNGFGNCSLDVAKSLPHTSGATLSAAKHAILNRCITCAPCSGFHHAEWDQTMGFCTFNGLMITALALQAENIAQKIGIIDCDQHYGNGTDQIIEKLNVQHVDHFTAGKHYQYVSEAEHFLNKILPHVLTSMKGSEVILYQAGADPHVDDPFGGWLTTEQLRLRDQIVFQFAAEHQIPLVWNLAGGYQKELDGSIPKVLEIHTNTMKECLRAF